MNIRLKELRIYLTKNSPLRSFILICIICCLHLTSTKAQTNSLSFQNQSALEIIQKVESSLEIKFNFVHDQLPPGKFSFSVSGDDSHLINQVFTTIDRNYKLLDEKIYVINDLPLSDDKRIEPPIFAGIVKSNSGEILPYCSIVIENLNTGYETDDSGEFRFQRFLSDQEIISFRYIGYSSKAISAKEISLDPIIILEEEEHIMGEIIIKDFLRIHQTSKLEDYQKINKEKVEVPGSGSKDLLLLAQALPGINSTSESLSDLQIRGGPPDQTAYKWNGINLLQNSLFYGRISSVNPFMVDQIKISRNGASASASSQASGSIELEADEAIEQKMETYLFSDLLHFNIGIGVPIVENKLSIKTAYRQSHTQYFESKIQQNIFDQLFIINKIRDDEYYTENFDNDQDSEFNESFQFNEWSGSLNYHPTANTKLKLAATTFGNVFQYQFDQKFWERSLIEDTLNVSTLGLSALLEHKFSQSLRLEAMATKSKFSNKYTHDNDVRSDFNQAFRTLENEVDNNQFKLGMKYHAKAFDLSFGIQREDWDVTFIDTTLVRGSALFDIKERSASAENSAYLMSHLNFIPKTQIELGYRLSKYDWALDGRRFLEPRMHISYLANQHLKLHAHYGRYHQNLNRRDYTLPLDVEKGIWFLSDERFGTDNFIWIVMNRQSSIGAQFTKDDWKYSIDIFDKRISNLWTSALNFSVQEDPFKFSDLKARGIEFATQYEQKNYKFLLSYEFTDENLFVYEDDVNFFKLRSPYAQRHRASMYHQLFKNNWSFGTMLKYASGRFYSRGESLIYDTDINYLYINYPDGLLSEQAPYYLSLDASIFYHVSMNQKPNMKFGLHAWNLFNRSNVIKRQSYIDYTQSPFALADSERPGIPFSINVSAEISF